MDSDRTHVHPHIEQTLRDWIAFYHHARGAGHTRAAVNGAGPSKAIVVCHNYSYAQALAKTASSKTIVYNRTETLRGLRAPVVWDNCALIDVFIQSANRIERLDKRAEQQEVEITQLRARISEQNEQLNRCKRSVWNLIRRWMRALRR